MTDTIRFTLDGREAEALPGETIWQVARRMQTEIPHLCYAPEPGYRADGKGITGPIYARAIDRTEGHPKAMEILLKHLPAANIHPPTTDFWAGRACHPPVPEV